jgi:hypothetical protein
MSKRIEKLQLCSHSPLLKAKFWITFIYLLLSIPVNLHYLLNKKFNAIMAVDVIIIVLWNSIRILLLWVCLFHPQKKPSINIWTIQRSAVLDGLQNCDPENIQPPSYKEVMKM